MRIYIRNDFKILTWSLEQIILKNGSQFEQLIWNSVAFGSNLSCTTTKLCKASVKEKKCRLNI